MTVGGGDLQMQPKTREGWLWKAACEAAEARAEIAIRRMAEMAEPGWIGAFAARDAAVADRDQWRARESETQEALQKMGEQYGVHGGEPRVAGIGRVLAEQRSDVERLNRTFAAAMRSARPSPGGHSAGSYEDSLMTSPSPEPQAPTLEPCPFCGSDNVIVHENVHAAFYGHCWLCEARGPIAASKKDATLAWNERGQPRQAETADDAPVTIRYQNWRGETADRNILPHRIFWGSNEWHPEPQWLIEAEDVERRVRRTFAWSGILPPEQSVPIAPAPSDLIAAPVIGLEPPGCPIPGACACPGGEAEMAKRLGEARDSIATLTAENKRLRDALIWYAEKAEGCRKLGHIGDPHRNALDADGGQRARAALSTPSESEPGR